MFARPPIGVTHFLSLFPTILLWALVRLGFGRIEYFNLLCKISFRQMRSIVFDQMLPRIANYWRRDEVESLLRGAGLTDVRTAPLNGMSWTAIGTRADSGVRLTPTACQRRSPSDTRLDESGGPDYRFSVSQDRTSGERMAGPIASTTESALHTENARTTLQLAFFAICLSLAQAAFIVAFRTGLPTPALSYTIGPAILVCTVLGPTLWASRAPGRVKWIGPLAMAVFLASFVLVAFGIVFQVLVFAAALFLLARALLTIGRPTLLPGRLALWLALFLAVLAVSTIQIAGIKYVNYVADQLMLAGRTDGDMLMHAAMGNAIRYFHFPSTGIDGLRLDRYHFGIDLLTALLSRGTGFDIVLSMIAIKIPLLIPLMSFGAGWGGLIIGRTLMPQGRFSALALVTGGSAVAFLLESALVGNLSSYSDPLLLSGVLMMLSAPTIIRILNDTAAEPGAVRLAWSLAVLGIFVFGIAKISNGFVWSGLVVFWAWRRYGLGAGFWAVSIAAGIVFIPAYLLTVDRVGASAVLFGTPYFVERGFSKPLLVYFQPLVATLWLALLTRDVARGTRRFLIESLAIAIFVGMLPGLFMEIDGGDAVQFMLAGGWFALPILTALLAGLPDRVAGRAAGPRRLVWSWAVLAAVACVVLGASDVRLKFNIFMAYNALLHTGDRSYYDEDNKRGWREDGRRAWATYGLGVFRLPPPQAGKSLADALLAYKAETGNEGAAYLAPQSDYWPLVSDCDGKATYPMSVAGVPVIYGYLPVQSTCPQQFSLRGYGAAPETHSDLGDQELCSRARQEGFPVVLRIESLADRSRDRKITCP